jgi:hypothetical protein
MEISQQRARESIIECIRNIHLIVDLHLSLVTKGQARDFVDPSMCYVSSRVEGCLFRGHDRGIGCVR